MLLRVAFLILFATALSAAPPTPEAFLGYPVGERFTPHHRIVAYFEELARQSPLLTVEQIGETYEGRPLVLVTVTSPKNRAALDTIRRNLGAIAAGETGADAVLSESPAAVWLGFGVHGNESSSAEAALLVAHRLVSDASAAPMLDRLVILIDPLQNPDGRERYIESFRRARGIRPNANPDSFEHMEPWPGGRFNHYLMDMNRDWSWLSQRESQARVSAYERWNPQVLVDFHEMSHMSSYFFPPDAKPLNANLPADIEKWLDLFGRANAAEFSKRGWTFFVGERFDLFYPGYGDSWPSLRGAVGMTYEMAGGGRAGTVVEREDGTVLTLADRALRHYTTAMTTLAVAAEQREALLRYTWQSARAQIEGGRNTFLIRPESPSFEPLITLLLRHGIRVGMLEEAVTVRATRIDRESTESHSFPAGTAVVSTRQPLGRLANTLLERTPVLAGEFVSEQREKAQADEPADFYDLTAWSLPLAMNVEAWVTQSPVAAGRPFAFAADAPFAPASYGWIVDGHDANVHRLAGRLIEHEINFSVAADDIRIGERPYPRGTIVVLRNNNAAEIEKVLAGITAEADVSAAPIESGWAGGTPLGSDKIRWVKRPRVGLVGGPGSNSTSFGMLWHTLDADTPIPHSTLVAEALPGLDLDEYDVLIFPQGSYAARLGKPGVDKVKQWVNDGGTVIVVGSGGAFLREKEVEVSKLKQWEPPKKKDEEPATPQRYHDFSVPGSAFRTKMNERSYLTLGVPRPPAVLVEGSLAFLPVAHAVDNIVTIDPTDPLISGVAWDESLQRLKGSVYVARESFGKGEVITFAADPHYRLFWRGTLPIFLNAVLYSTSFAR